MSPSLQGLHHVTAIASDPQQNIEFYTRLLGLRLVKLTVNFDDPGTYHLYYGNYSGQPGSILAFYPWARVQRGETGYGQAASAALLVPPGSLGFWQSRIHKYTGQDGGLTQRFNEEVLSFEDTSGLLVELVAREGVQEAPFWMDGPIDGRYALRGLADPCLIVNRIEKSAALLERLFGLSFSGQAGNRYRFSLPGQPTSVDLLLDPTAPRGKMGTGVIHHLAWRAADVQELLDWRKILVSQFFNVSQVQDRKYYQSIYFREPGGALLEIATDRPGFSVDEGVATLGTQLMLPDWLETRRQSLMGLLPAIYPTGDMMMYQNWR